MKKNKKWWKKILSTRFAKTLKTYIGFDDFLAIFFMALGMWQYLANDPNPLVFDTKAELIGIGITVFVLGNVNQYMEIKADKNRLILQMGSPNNSFAIEAVRQLGHRGWIQDGTLRNANLTEANLNNAQLFDADLRDTILFSASLVKAQLINTNLSGANLVYTDMNGCFIIGSNLSKTNLIGANLSDVVFDDKTIWEGAKFTTTEPSLTVFPDNFDPIEKGMIRVDNIKKSAG